jgi:hypothetical protein
MLPPARQVVPVPLSADTDLNVEAEQTQPTIGRQAACLQVVFVDMRVVPANNAFRSPASHG